MRQKVLLRTDKQKDVQTDRETRLNQYTPSPFGAGVNNSHVDSNTPSTSRCYQFHQICFEPSIKDLFVFRKTTVKMADCYCGPVIISCCKVLQNWWKLNELWSLVGILWFKIYFVYQNNCIVTFVHWITCILVEWLVQRRR